MRSEEAHGLAINDQVRDYWELEPCGTAPSLVGGEPRGEKAWFEAIENRRYELEPFIHSFAQFTRHSGERLLEIGVGAGTDHLQWARAGAICHGVDLTDAAVELTRTHLRLYGLESHLARCDAEMLPFEDGVFDVVYSWGVIHHSEHPERIVQEIHRVLRPGGLFLGMVYGRRSVVALKLWVRHALFKGHPRRSLGEVVWHQMESVGTKSYTGREVRQLFAGFRGLNVDPIVTPYDRGHLPGWLGRAIPRQLGWFIAVRAVK
jgi:SAM-dependent methyltransferase